MDRLSPVAVNSRVLGDAAAAAVSRFASGLVVDPSTQGADAHPSDPVTRGTLGPPPTVPPPPVTLKVAQFKNGASLSSRCTSSCSPVSSRRNISYGASL